MKKEKVLKCCAAILATLIATDVHAQAHSDADYYYRWIENGDYTQSHPKIYYNGYSGTLDPDVNKAKNQFASKGNRTTADRDLENNGAQGTKPKAPYRNTYDSSGKYWIPVKYLSGSVEEELLLDFSANQFDYDNTTNSMTPQFRVHNVSSSGVYSNTTNVKAIDQNNKFQDMSAQPKLHCGAIGGQALACDATYGYKSVKDSSENPLKTKLKIAMQMPYRRDGNINLSTASANDKEVADINLRDCYDCHTTNTGEYCKEVLQEIARTKCGGPGPNYVNNCNAAGIENLVAALAEPRGTSAKTETRSGVELDALPEKTMCNTCLAKAGEYICLAMGLGNCGGL